ncbi:MAG TPA: hypothetical protein VG101_03155 [Puia sp.]|jgi:hypothetical protein|nr:hypothetical protein [Puia sp.]
MKLILLLPLVCGLMTVAAGQQYLQFIYIGSDQRGRESVLITSSNSQADYLKGKDSRMVKVYYADQRTIDSIRSYISRSKWVNGLDSFSRGNGEKDSPKLPDAYKIMGVDSHPLYIEGKGCLNLFLSTGYYLGSIGLGFTGGSNAMENLTFQCDQEFLLRHLIKSPRPQIQDPYPKLNPETPPPIHPLPPPK